MSENTSDIKFSLEIFPPKTPAQEEQLWRSVDAFCNLKPEYISITCGAFGSVHGNDLTRTVALKIMKKKATPAAHLTCLGKTKQETSDIVKDYKKQGVNRVIALRGDIPQTPHIKKNTGAHTLRYARELVEIITAIGDFHISVAAYPEGHPEANSMTQDLLYLKEKMEAGAHCAITQFFFDPEIFLRFRDKAVSYGISKPIIPGILPILNIEKVCKFAEKCKIDVPNYLLRMYQGVSPHTLDHKLLAMNVLSHQLTRLIAEGVRMFHFYTLNETAINTHICRWLKEAF